MLGELTDRAGIWGEALDAAAAKDAAVRPGYTPHPNETLAKAPFRWEVVDSCRRAFVGVCGPLGGGVIAITSPHRGEGRSTVAAGVALVVAQDSGAQTLLLDLDFKTPAQHRIFSVAESPGLADFIQTDRPLRVIRGGPGGRLSLIPGGSPIEDPAWVLHELAKNDILAACRARFTWVVVDLPPLLDRPVAALLAAQADAYLLLGRYRTTPLVSLERASELLSPEMPGGVVITADTSRIPGWLERVL